MSYIDTAAAHSPYNLKGAFGATCCTFVGSPFDVAKSRLQTQGFPPQYRGLIHCMTQLLRTDGFFGLYRGVIPSLSSAVVENSLGVTVQRFLSRLLGSKMANETTRHSASLELALGAATGVVTSIAICPFEVLKVRQQVLEAQGRSGGVFPVLISLLADEGPKGLFRGLSSTMGRDVPLSAFFYGTYESCCTFAMTLEDVSSKDDLSSQSICCSGSCAGTVAWSIMLPMDVVKTRLQAGKAQGSARSVLRRIVINEGWKYLFRSWAAVVARAIPVNATFFLAVETSTRWMKARPS